MRENLERDLGFGLQEEREGVLVRGDALPAHNGVDKDCGVLVGGEASDDGVVGEDIAAGNLFEDGEGVGVGEGREGYAMKE